MTSNGHRIRDLALIMNVALIPTGQAGGWTHWGTTAVAHTTVRAVELPRRARPFLDVGGRRYDDQEPNYANRLGRLVAPDRLRGATKHA
jgi:hypothetical protein